MLDLADARRRHVESLGNFECVQPAQLGKLERRQVPARNFFVAKTFLKYRRLPRGLASGERPFPAVAHHAGLLGIELARVCRTPFIDVSP